MLSRDWVYFKVPPAEMTIITRIMEGYEYIGVVTALDGKQGIGYVRTTTDTAPMAKEILDRIPVETQIFSFDDACIQAYAAKMQVK